MNKLLDKNSLSQLALLLFKLVDGTSLVDVYILLRKKKESSTFVSLAVPWIRHSSRKSSATHSYHCVQYFHVSKQWYDCQCLGFLTCATDVDAC